MQITTVSDFVAIGAFMLATATSLTGVALWYAKSEKRKYGMERDFSHIKRNYEQIQLSLKDILKELDSRFNSVEKDVLEIKSQLHKKE